MTKRNKDILSLAHDVYFMYLWFQFLALGKSLYNLSSLSDGLKLIQNNQLYLVRLIQNYLSMTKGIHEFLWMSIQDVSMAVLILWILFWIIDKREMIITSILAPLSILILVLLSLNSPTLVIGIQRINFIGMGVMIVSTIIIFYNFARFLNQILND